MSIEDILDEWEMIVKAGFFSVGEVSFLLALKKKKTKKTNAVL